eukprot:3938439-Rhodomonas_salina.2
MSVPVPPNATSVPDVGSAESYISTRNGMRKRREIVRTRQRSSIASTGTSAHLAPGNPLLVPRKCIFHCQTKPSTGQRLASGTIIRYGNTGQRLAKA